MFIRTVNLSHVYMPGTPFAARALEEVNLTVERGSFTALLGPSGSGKSTLLQHLNGLLRPTAGRIFIDGREVGGEKEELLRLRRRIGLVFQVPEEQFFAETVYDEVAFAPRNLGLSAGEVEARVAQALGLVGQDYSALKDRSPFQLSAGQKRLVAVAAVLALRPEALLLDEPTAGLDQAGQETLFALLARLNREAALTVVVVTHHFERVADLADSVVVLHRGRVALAGSPAQVFARGEELVRLGLELPPVTGIMHELAAAGLPVRTAVFSLEEARLEITAARRRREGKP